jgi:hypothetical protein
MKIVDLYTRIFQILRFFEGNCDHDPAPIKDDIAKREYTLIDTKSVEFIETHYPGFLKNDELRARLDNGDRLIGLGKDATIASWGWWTSRPEFWISEIGFSLNTKGNCVLYDFYTDEPFKRQGLYKILLSYCFSTDVGSLKAIVFTHFTNVAPLKVYAFLGLKEISPLILLLTGRFSRKRKR